MTAAASSPPTKLALAAGFAAIYIIWGSTYLAIRFGVETLPPFLMAAVRFIIPGLVMYAWLRRRGAPRPTAAQWRGTALTGALMLAGGNGIVTWAEQWVPSGLTALIIASVPLSMGAMAWVVEPGNRPGARGIAGVVLGFGGVAILVEPGGELGGDLRTMLAALSLVLASALWAAGSLVARHVALPKSAMLSTAMQMIGGAAVLTLAGTATGEWGRIDISGVSAKSLAALFYLMTAGSVVALSAYVWLLQVTTPAKVSTYAYVNPVVAVFLGWLLAGEVVTGRTVAAAAVILFAVLLITTERAKRGRPKEVIPDRAPAAGADADCRHQPAAAAEH